MSERSTLSTLRQRIATNLRRFGGRAASQGASSSPAEGQAAAAGDVRRGPPPLRARAGSRPGGRHVLAVVVGLSPDDLETVVQRLSSERTSVPIFLTDDDRFEIFRRERAVFEYLPAIEPAADLDVDLYRLRRLALLRRKWQPAKIVAFGAQAVRLVQAWRASPFEDQRIYELTGSQTSAQRPCRPDGA